MHWTPKRISAVHSAPIIAVRLYYDRRIWYAFFVFADKIDHIAINSLSAFNLFHHDDLPLFIFIIGGAFSAPPGLFIDSVQRERYARLIDNFYNLIRTKEITELTAIGLILFQFFI